MITSDQQPANPWPHRLAVLLVCATFPLIWVGGLVTTHKAGMAVPDWPSTFGYNLFLYPWSTWVAGPWDIFVEHGHRLLGALVGTITIALLATVLWTDSRRWVRWFAAATLLAVIGQGVLGGMRVLFDQILFAKIHGCTGPLFFALTAALAVFTSTRWRTAAPTPDAAGAKLGLLATQTTALTYLQIVLGAQLRHVAADGGMQVFRAALWFHLVMAMVLTAQVAWLVRSIWTQRARSAWLVNPALALAGLIALQVALGASTWIAKYGWPAWFQDLDWAQAHLVRSASFWQSTVTTAHVAVGSLIFVTSLVIALRASRLYRPLSAATRPSHLTLGVAL